MESIAVIKVAVGVTKAEMVSLHQDHDELFRTFALCVMKKAAICKLTTVIECECGKKCYKFYIRSNSKRDACRCR